MKKFLSLLFFVAAMFTMQAQTNIATAMSNPTNVDSATVKYISTSAPLPGLLNININITKVANTGSTVAGYCILLGSDNDTDYYPVKTCKLIKDSTSAYGRNINQVDTFFLANTTDRQKYSWNVRTCDVAYHPYLYYKVGVYVTTTTVAARGNRRFQKLE